MSDVNNKLRLQIVTELDAAGIKATKDQIDGLELGLRRAGKTGEESGQKFGALESALGKLPGPLGGIGKALGGLAGQATMVFGAFSLGVQIGEKIMDFAKKLGLVEDYAKESAKAARAYNQELSDLKTCLAAVSEAEMKRFDAAAERSAKLIKAIDAETAAYFRQASALSGLEKVGNDAELQQLERAKYEEMSQLSAGGFNEAAEQVGKYYDILKAELIAKREIEAFDRESNKLTVERENKERAAAVAAERAADAKERQRMAEKALADFDASYGPMLDQKKEAQLKELTRVAERAKREAERAQETAEKRSEGLDVFDSQLLERRMARANLVAAGTDAKIRAADEYDRYVSSVSDPTRLFGGEGLDDWGKELIREYSAANENQKQILEELRNFTGRFEKLLELK